MNTSQFQAFEKIGKNLFSIIMRNLVMFTISVYSLFDPDVRNNIFAKLKQVRKQNRKHNYSKKACLFEYRG